MSRFWDASQNYAICVKIVQQRKKWKSDKWIKSRTLSIIVESGWWTMEVLFTLSSIFKAGHSHSPILSALWRLVSAFWASPGDSLPEHRVEQRSAPGPQDGFLQLPVTSISFSQMLPELMGQGHLVVRYALPWGPWLLLPGWPHGWQDVLLLADPVGPSVQDFLWPMLSGSLSSLQPKRSCSESWHTNSDWHGLKWIKS